MERFSSKEYKEYAPIRHWISVALAVIIFVIFIVYSATEDLIPGNVMGITMLFLCSTTLILISSSDRSTREAREAQSNAMYQRQIDINDGVRAMSSRFEDISSRISEINAKGHVVMAGNGAIVNIDSTIVNSFLTIEREDPVLADAIKKISGEVESSGNKEAGRTWARFLKELNGEKDKSVMSALWSKVINLVPDIAKLAESSIKIASLFA